MKSITFIISKVIFLPFLLSISCSSIEKGESQPNIIIILADDLGYRDVGYMGGTLTPTPFIDDIAENGVWFTSGYSSCPVCAPGRAGLLTGRYQNRFGFEDNGVVL